MDDITAEMELAGHKAEQAWHAGGQSGPLPRAIYHAMYAASGAKDVETHMLGFDADMLAAGMKASEAFDKLPSGLRPVKDMYLAMHAAH